MLRKLYMRKYKVREVIIKKPIVKERTYLVYDTQPTNVIETLLRLLDSNGFKGVSVLTEDAIMPSNEHFTFMYTMGTRIKITAHKENLYTNTALIQNIFTQEKLIIANKCMLHEAFKIYLPGIYKRYLAETDYIGLHEYRDGEKLIMRSYGMGQSTGKGIEYITNREEFDKLKRKFGITQTIVSKYIENPLLYDEKKFHMRIYLIIMGYPLNAISILHKGKIITAGNPYNTDIHDTEAHDTHAKRTSHTVFFPDDFNQSHGLDENQIQNIWEQINHICAGIHTIYRPFVKPYDNIATGFEMFGLDFMIDDRYNVYLLEVNWSPGMGVIGNDSDSEKKERMLEANIAEWTFDCMRKLLEHEPKLSQLKEYPMEPNPLHIDPKRLIPRGYKPVIYK